MRERSNDNIDPKNIEKTAVETCVLEALESMSVVDVRLLVGEIEEKLKG